MGFGRVVVMAGLLCLGVAQSALAALGVEAPMQEIGTEVWGTVIPVALGLTAATMLLVAWLMHHAGLFIAIVVMAVVIFSIGFGIPTLMQAANLNWFF